MVDRWLGFEELRRPGGLSIRAFSLLTVVLSAGHISSRLPRRSERGGDAAYERP